MLLRILIFLVLAPALAQAGSRDARERQAVVKIFDLLTSKMDVRSGDGIGSDLDCVFSRAWGVTSYDPAQGETHHPHELLSLQQALDPHGEHSDMFCDRDERDKQAKILAQSNGKGRIAAANVDFSYPIFGRNFQTATVHYYRATVLLETRHNYPPAASWGLILLRKQQGVWTFKLSVEGMS